MKVKMICAATVLAGSQIPISAIATETITYSYDSLGRLINQTSSGTVNNGQVVSIAHDPADNRTNLSVSGVAIPAVSISPATVTEGGSLSFLVTLSYAAPATITVNYSSTDGTAVSPADYSAVSGTLTFTTGQASKTIFVSTVDDAAVEASEAMTVTLSSPSGATLGTASGTGTIDDNDTSTATISIGDASITEGGTLSFTVTRSGATSSAVSASFATSGGTATSGSDFTAASGTVSFASGQVTNTISVATIDDATVESVESMTVGLSNASSGAVIGTATGTGTINDNDTGGSPAISVADAEGTEGGTVVFTLTRTGDTSALSSVQYATVSGTATIGVDVASLSGTRTFAVGEVTRTITVTTTDDSNFEGTETFSLVISNPVNATISDNTGNGTLYDND